MRGQPLRSTITIKEDALRCPSCLRTRPSCLRTRPSCLRTRPSCLRTRPSCLRSRGGRARSGASRAGLDVLTKALFASFHRGDGRFRVPLQQDRTRESHPLGFTPQRDGWRERRRCRRRGTVRVTRSASGRGGATRNNPARPVRADGRRGDRSRDIPAATPVPRTPGGAPGGLRITARGDKVIHREGGCSRNGAKDGPRARLAGTSRSKAPAARAGRRSKQG